MTLASEAVKETRALGGLLPKEPAEDMLVGSEIQRHGLASRVIHWSVAATFVLCLATGMPIWFPVFGWMSLLFGGLQVCRWLHPWIGWAFFGSMLLMFSRWAAQMALEPSEWAWIGPKTLEYLRFDREDPDVGRYNGGQKIFFWASAAGALGLLLSGVVLWYPESFPQWLRELSVLVHDLAFILFFLQAVAHVYLATAAEPGTFRAMVNGRVTRAWAKVHHAKWYRQVTGAQSK
jgi:formate dehydrogenase subunit gamma